MNLYKKAIEEISQEMSWDNWEVPEVLYSKLQWTLEKLSQEDEDINSELIDALIQCQKLLETLDDNGIKKII